MTQAGDFFGKHGYYLAQGVFGDYFLGNMQTDFNWIVEQLQNGEESANARWGSAEYVEGGKDSVIIHTHQVQAFSALWMQAFMDKEFLDVAEELIGPDIILHHSKLFHKPAFVGSPFPLHQDFGYFPTVNDSMIAAVIHLTDSDEERGCLRIVPGSHKMGRLDPQASFLGDDSGVAEQFIKDHPLDSAKPMIAKAGDVLFFHYFTLHGSKANTSPYERQTMLVQMHAGDDAMENPGHTYSGDVLRGRNRVITRSQAAVV